MSAMAEDLLRRLINDPVDWATIYDDEFCIDAGIDITPDEAAYLRTLDERKPREFRPVLPQPIPPDAVQFATITSSRGTETYFRVGSDQDWKLATSQER